MKKLQPDTSRLSVVALLLLLIALVIIGVAGYFLVKHTDKEAETTTYGGYSFPAMPLDFKYVSKTLRNDVGSPEVDYTNSTSLATIESEVLSICKESGYSSEGGFTTKINRTVDDKQLPPDYEASCDTNTTNWQFDIIPAAKASTFDISVLSGPVLTSTSKP